jgi:outer membrane protein assembly factor BamB
MNVEKTASWLAGTVTTAVAAVALGCWLGCGSGPEIRLGLPGMDGRPESSPEATEAPVVIGGLFAQGDGEPAVSDASWPGFRGLNRDNILDGSLPLADRWPEGGPPRLWELAVGEGHAAPSVHRGRVYLLDYLEDEKADMLRCLSLADGREIWRRGHHVQVKRNHGMSRTIPAVTDRAVVTIGPRGHVMACDPVNGNLLWGIDLVAEHGAKIPGWYTGQCPLLDGDVAVLAPAGPEVLLLGVDAVTGAERWRTPNPGGWVMSHSSVMPMTLAGQRMYVYVAVGGVCGVAADGPEVGRILWQTNAWNQNVVAPSPVILPDGRIFLGAGYGGGGMMLRVVAGEDGFTVVPGQRVKPAEGFCSEQQTPVFLAGHLFGILPKDAGARRNELVCCHPDDLAAIVWSSGKTERFGLGPYLVADNKFLILEDSGVLTMAEATTAGYRRLAQARILDGRDAWGPLALADGRLLLRDSTRLLCLDLRPQVER